MEMVMFLYQGMTALDFIGPHEVLSRLPGARVTRAAESLEPVVTDSGVRLLPDAVLEDVTTADILLVPGAGNAWNETKKTHILDWLRRLDAGTTWTTSVCTGSLILAAAGLLEGREATCHWAELAALEKFGALPVSRRVVESDKYVTGAGVSAGIDMALTLAAKLAGEPLAMAIQLGIEYDPDPPFDVGSPQKAPPELLEGVKQILAAERKG